MTNKPEPAQVGASSFLIMQRTLFKLSATSQCQKNPKQYTRDTEITFSPSGSTKKLFFEGYFVNFFSEKSHGAEKSFSFQNYFFSQAEISY